MCTHGRWVHNRYTRQKFWCKCGKCKSCQQEKAAARSSRIRNEYDGNSVVYFCTLTYDRLSCPYFRLDELEDIKKRGFGFLNIYRKHDIKWSVNKQKYVKSWKPVLLCQVPVETDKFLFSDLRFKELSKQKGCVGVCLFNDLQLFHKRFRQNIKRFGLDGKIKLFNCSEYGGHSQRPHFHFLLWSSSSNDQERLHEAFVKAWPFGVRVRAKESFELVRDDPAGYVASYVNSGSNISPFLTCYFAPKHSASKLFGHGKKVFSLDKISELIGTGYLHYTSQRVVGGIPQVFDLPIPKYVINRYFPLFKGYSRFTSAEVYDYISTGFNDERLLEYSRQQGFVKPHIKIDISPSDAYKIHVRLSNAFCSYKKTFPTANLYDYAIMYEKAWRAYKSTVYRFFMEDEEIPFFYKYDNMCEQSEDVQKFFYENHVPFGAQFVVDNNEKPYVKNNTLKMELMYDKYSKQKDITNYVLDCQGVYI